MKAGTFLVGAIAGAAAAVALSKKFMGCKCACSEPAERKKRLQQQALFDATFISAYAPRSRRDPQSSHWHMHL